MNGFLSGEQKMLSVIKPFCESRIKRANLKNKKQMKIIAMTILMGVATLANAQTSNQNPNRDHKSDHAIAQSAEDLAKQLDITQDQADKAWPIFAEYKALKEAKRDERLEEINTRRANKSERTDEDIEKAFYENIKSQRDALDMDEAYFKRFREILPADKSMSLMRQIRMAKRQNRSRKDNMHPAAVQPQDRLSK